MQKLLPLPLNKQNVCGPVRNGASFLSKKLIAYFTLLISRSSSCLMQKMLPVPLNERNFNGPVPNGASFLSKTLIAYFTHLISRGSFI